MLARLSRGATAATQLLDGLLLDPPEGKVSPEEGQIPEGVLSLDINVLGAVVPLPDLTLGRLAGLCGRTILPACKGLQTMVHDDIERLARLFSDLDPLVEADEDCSSLTDDHSEKAPAPLDYRQYTINSTSLRIPTSLFERPFRKRRRSSTPALTHPLVIPSPHPSAPAIVITPAPVQPRETSAWVPLQDSAYGLALCVPHHRAQNASFPPLALAPSKCTRSAVERWRYVNGHWRAVLPTVEEQARRGMVSRVAVRSGGRVGTFQAT